MPTSQPGDVPTHVVTDVFGTGHDAIEIVERGTFDDYESTVRVPPKTHPVALAIALMRNLSVVSALADGVETRFQLPQRGVRNVTPILRLDFPDEPAADTNEFAGHQAT